MAHAVVIQVKIEPDSDREHRHSILNDFVVPEAKALPGFEQGIWMNDGGGTGTCVVLFDTEDHATAAIVPLTRPGGPPGQGGERKALTNVSISRQTNPHPKAMGHYVAGVTKPRPVTW